MTKDAKPTFRPARRQVLMLMGAAGAGLMAPSVLGRDRALAANTALDGQLVVSRKWWKLDGGVISG